MSTPDLTHARAHSCCDLIRREKIHTCCCEAPAGGALLEAGGGLLLPGSRSVIMQARLTAGIAVSAGADAADGAGVGHGSAQRAFEACSMTDRLQLLYSHLHKGSYVSSICGVV